MRVLLEIGVCIVLVLLELAATTVIVAPNWTRRQIRRLAGAAIARAGIVRRLHRP